MFEVEYFYSYDPGVHTLPNGDPGYPPSEEIEIVSIRCSGNLLGFLTLNCEDVVESIETKISEMEK